jgi:glucose-6-phosphate-specific signal transduction histidine kinase
MTVQDQDPQFQSHVMSESRFQLFPELELKYQVAIGVALTPILSVSCYVICYVLVQRRKWRYGPSNATPPATFKPTLLLPVSLLFLIGLILSATALIEISCHTIPNQQDLTIIPTEMIRFNLLETSVNRKLVVRATTARAGLCSITQRTVTSPTTTK